MISKLLRKLIDPILTRAGSGFIECTHRGQFVFLTLTPECCDYGRLIGKGGQNFLTLKNLLIPIAEKQNKALRFSILEGPERVAATPFKTNDNWKPEEVSQVVSGYMEAMGQPAEVEAFPDLHGWRIIAAGQLPKQQTEDLRRWVSIMAASNGGRALLTDESVPV